MIKNMYRYILAGTAAAAICFPTMHTVSAMDTRTPASQVLTFAIGSKSVLSGDMKFQLPDAPYTRNHTAMFPIRDFAQAFGYTVTWDGKRATILLENKVNKMVFKPSSRLITVDGQERSMKEAVEIVNGKAFVPIRQVAEAIGAQVGWNGKTKSVTVTKKPLQESELVYRHDFRNGADGWKAGFADMPLDHAENDYRLMHGVKSIPMEGQPESNGMLLSGMNRSDDLFMYLYRKLDTSAGIQPNTRYQITLEFDLAADAAKDSIGIGGSPGSSVYVKAGVVAQEPQTAIEDGYYRMTLDKGNQASPGKDMKVLGTVEKERPDTGYEWKHFSTTVECISNAKGELYFIIGTDSGYEGLTSVYYSNIRIGASKM